MDASQGGRAARECPYKLIFKPSKLFALECSDRTIMVLKQLILGSNI
jgi:hypothetical protein